MKDVQIQSGRVLFAAAAMWAASFAFVAPSFGADPAPADAAKSAEHAADKTDDAAQETKAAADQLTKDAAAATPAPAVADDIRASLAGVTEAAVTKQRIQRCGETLR